MTHFRLLAASGLLLSLLAMGCSSDDGENNATGPGGGGGTKQIDLSSATVAVPPAMQTAANGGNAGAAQAVATIQQLNLIASYGMYFTPPARKLAGLASPHEIYSWSVGGLSIILEVNQESSVFTWAVTLNGTDGETTYDNHIFIRGYRENDNASGNMSVYDPADPGSALLFWTWGVNPNNVFAMTLYAYDENAEITSSINPNGSGSVSQSVGGVLSFNATWNSDGSGSYTIYDGSGDPADSGTW